MEQFQKYPTILQSAEAKRIIKNYNKLAKVLVEFEVLYHQAWLKQVCRLVPSFRFIACVFLSCFRSCSVFSVFFFLFRQSFFLVVYSLPRIWQRDFSPLSPLAFFSYLASISSPSYLYVIFWGESFFLVYFLPRLCQWDFNPSSPLAFSDQILVWDEMSTSGMKFPPTIPCLTNGDFPRLSLHLSRFVLAQVEVAKSGLQASLLVRHPESKELYVNFDPQILTLIRETECMVRLSLEIPLSAQTLLHKKENLKNNYNQLQVTMEL